ncbi:hypothetical protein PAXRUDRAFT_19555 [Paxillus rubicundulus Ve08.2h10]|uniref:Uncharacterized protein n=1 Tax=Paxillus rubicundulus Ve08.2h10 TaxID=930991 RepID=A0A0D0BTK0_9AGAM|nr:hypothetical protein PAXRUDRAFT_19555 [Paxillus rubicundulus Ve08.2h10]
MYSQKCQANAIFAQLGIYPGVTISIVGNIMAMLYFHKSQYLPPVILPTLQITLEDVYLLL